MTWSAWAKDKLKGLLVILALAAAFVLAVQVLAFLRDSGCNRLNDARLEHLEPGHEEPGPGSIYVIGVGTGPPPSQLEEYHAAEAEMENSGCEGTGRPGPGQ